METALNRTHEGIREFKAFCELVAVTVQLNLKAEATKSYLGYLWWLLEPAMFVAVFYFVFGVFLAQGGDNFVVFLICGQIPFLWFSRSISNSSNAISSGAGLMNQIHIPALFFPATVILQDFYKSICVILLMVVFVFITGSEPSITWLSLPLLVLTQLLFVAAVAIACSMVVPFFPDIRFVIETGVMMMMFASGVFYSYQDVLLPEHREIFLLNPLANLIRLYRDVLMDGQWPEFGDLAIISAVSFFVIAVEFGIARRIDGRYPRLLIK